VRRYIRSFPSARHESPALHSQLEGTAPVPARVRAAKANSLQISTLAYSSVKLVPVKMRSAARSRWHREIRTPVVELGGARIGMIGQILSSFERAAVLQKGVKGEN